jgi:D-aminoacyl-tRNA deacylase
VQINIFGKILCNNKAKCRKMRVVIQRVLNATITINKMEIRSIDDGLLVLIGIEDTDSNDDIDWLCGKIVRLRIFADERCIMNKSLLDTKGNILLVSQFTLHASTKKGNRPSYIRASKPDIAIPLYEKFKNQLEIDLGKKIVTGEFGADMQISLINDGPVTIIIDSKNRE